MTDIAENTDTTEEPQPRLITTIRQCYRDNFGIFWRIMGPLIIFEFLFGVGASFSDRLSAPENLWRFDTARGLFVSEDPRAVGVGWKMAFGFHSFSISWLWLSMCPLTLAIMERRRGVRTTARDLWQQVRRKKGSILGASFLLYLLGVGGLLPFLSLTLKISPDIPVAPYGSSICLALFLLVGVVIYWGVNWSLYNQSIIIEDQRAIAAMRRSSELIRGVWGRTFCMYLLLALVTLLLTSVVLGLVLLVFSVTLPEFATLRRWLLSAKFFLLFVGGYARISFDNTPSLWTISIMVMVNTLIHACLAPIWAILTTHLYFERANG